MNMHLLNEPLGVVTRVCMDLQTAILNQYNTMSLYCHNANLRSFIWPLDSVLVVHLRKTLAPLASNTES